MSDFHRDFIKLAIEIYGLELDGHQIDTILATWLKQYDPTWILKAIVESLYRGRYKIVSVENILKDWHRLGNPRYQFTPEYEREIFEKIPQPLPRSIAVVAATALTDVGVVTGPEDALAVSAMPLPEDAPSAPPASQLPPMPIVRLNSEYLNPEESAPFQSHYHSLLLHNTARVGSNPVANLESTEAQLDRGSSLQLESIQRRGSFSHSEPTKLERIRIQPANCQLFNTLKAIVDPNYQRPVVDANTLAPNGNINNIASFMMPIDSPDREQQV
ncbi:hypothetical protein [Chamaesiphon sp. OTE_8_metabat_110]|uniref:hypothetical protein n=1 Tax=Chamaesiphon sp. OTE_8_metabat_110 TaxID=2964696 RepID=UPI00286B324D|nr:hypothetical protein [Chamaesiphon sp. OTE_8_metabat_110]